MANMLKNLLIVAFFVLLILVLNQVGSMFALGLYGLVLMFYLLAKLGLSFIYHPFKGETPQFKVAAVIPSYNENGPGMIDTLESIADQTYPVAEVYIVDDGSPDKTGFNMVKEHIAANPERFKNVILHEATENKGKRHAQAWAFERSDADVFLTIDSDTYAFPNALEELLKPFNDPNIHAATGHINARNRDENFLTRLIDIRYDNAFRVERAAQTMTGNILTCSGPLSVYRRELIMDNLHRYLNQSFLGVKVNIGDDRCLTNYANKLGRTVYQSTAKATTDVPNNLQVFTRQQIRWNKSFFRESLEAIKLGIRRPALAAWSTIEVILFVLLNYSLFSFAAGQFKDFNPMVFLIVLIAVCAAAFARNIHYAFKHPVLFLLAPFYGILHILLLQPIRLYALLTIRNVKWGTRKAKTQ